MEPNQDSKSAPLPEQPYAIVYFDGVCNLCNGAVTFIIQRDPERYFRFAPLQSRHGQEFLRRHGQPADTFDTIILKEGDLWYTHSAAALSIARRLKGAWPLLYGFMVLPRFIRDGLYRFIARNRYKWFGKQEACMIPTPELKSLFLD